MTDEPPIEDLLRELTPRVLAAVVRKFGDFGVAEDAVQEALLAAATQWPVDGRPANPRGWLIQVAARRMTDELRREDARRRREDLVFAQTAVAPPAPPDRDETLMLMLMCCHPALTPGAAIPLTLRAVGGLTTAEIARAFLLPESTMAQRISRAKQTIRKAGAGFGMPTADELPERLGLVLHVLYLIFNEGYATSAGDALARTDLSSEAIRLARLVRVARPVDPEVAGLLALMLLTDARRPARTDHDGSLVPLAEQDRSRWSRPMIDEGIALVEAALPTGPIGEYQVQAAIAAVHDEAPSADATDWAQIVALYDVLGQLTRNPMVALNRAVAVSMVEGPDAGLALLDALEPTLADHHRWHAVRAHLFEQAGDPTRAIEHYRQAAARTASLPEQRYLRGQATRLAHRPA